MDDVVVLDEFFQRFIDLLEQIPVSGKEFLRDRLNAESRFQFRKCGIFVCVLKKVEKPCLCGVATFVLADKVGEAAGRGEARLHAHLSRFLFNGGVLHLYIREPPLIPRRRNERHERGVLLFAVLEVIRHEITDGGAGALNLDSFARCTMRISSFSFPGAV